MTLMFYPHSDDALKGTLDERIEVLLHAAERYKAAVLDQKTGAEAEAAEAAKATRISVPRELEHSYNWDDVATVLRQTRELPEATREEKTIKSNMLTKLAEVYEVLRGAKMSKLEAVRLALVNEAKQLRGGSTEQVQ